MERNDNIITITSEGENFAVLANAIDRFKSVYRVSFESNNDHFEYKINIEDLDPDMIFNLGYYYGALNYIENKKRNYNLPFSLNSSTMIP